MKSVLNKQGFSLLEAMVGISLLATTALVTLQIADMLRSFHQKNSIHATMTSLRENIINTIINQQAWDQTKNQNNSLACNRVYPSTCASSLQGGPIDILTSNGTILINTLNTSAGFTEQGKPCTGFSSMGSTRCPIRITAHWEPLCSGDQGCKYPQEMVSVKFDYAPEKNNTKNVINFKNFDITRLIRKNLSAHSSPSIICSSMGLIYVGENNWVYNGNGIPTAANSDGCVPIAAFEGKEGPQGASGDSGVRGPSGSIVAAPAPAIQAAPQLAQQPAPQPSPPETEPSAVCKSNPWLCIKNILNKTPEKDDVTETASAPVALDKNAANWQAAAKQPDPAPQCKSGQEYNSSLNRCVSSSYGKYCTYYAAPVEVLQIYADQHCNLAGTGVWTRKNYCEYNSLGCGKGKCQCITDGTFNEDGVCYMASNRKQAYINSGYVSLFGNMHLQPDYGWTASPTQNNCP